MNKYPCAEFLNSRISISECGSMRWKETGNKKWDARYAGKEISCVGNHGYIVFNITVDGKKRQLLAHRVAFILYHGYEPEYIDHADGCRTNNARSNLRSCSNSQNLHNRTKTSRSTTGIKGVCKKKDSHIFIAYGSDGNGKTIYLGSFASADDAKKAHEEYSSGVAGKQFYRY